MILQVWVYTVINQLCLLNRALICSWDQPVLTKEGSFLLMKAPGALMRYKVTPDRHPPMTSPML